jgi:Ubiquitin carboxyl-terminal hydrolase
VILHRPFILIFNRYNRFQSLPWMLITMSFFSQIFIGSHDLHFRIVQTVSLNIMLLTYDFVKFHPQSACGAKIGIARTLLNSPDVVSVGIVWDSERPSADQVNSILKAIGTSLRLCDVFHQVSDAKWAQKSTHELVGVVSYYGKHYTTFFFHTKLRVWVYFDDANVKEVK